MKEIFKSWPPKCTRQNIIYLLYLFKNYSNNEVTRTVSEIIEAGKYLEYKKSIMVPKLLDIFESKHGIVYLKSLSQKPQKYLRKNFKNGNHKGVHVGYPKSMFLTLDICKVFFSFFAFLFLLAYAL